MHVGEAKNIAFSKIAYCKYYTYIMWLSIKSDQLKLSIKENCLQLYVVWSVELRNLKPGKHTDERQLIYADCAMDNCSELKIGQQCLKFTLVRYMHLYTLRKCMNPFLLPQLHANYYELCQQIIISKKFLKSETICGFK